MGVARELLPCPLPFPDVEGARVKGVSRSVQRRLQRKGHWQSWANEGVAAICQLLVLYAGDEQILNDCTEILKMIPKHRTKGKWMTM